MTEIILEWNASFYFVSVNNYNVNTLIECTFALLINHTDWNVLRTDEVVKLLQFKLKFGYKKQK